MGNWFSSNEVLEKTIEDQKKQIAILNATILRLESQRLRGPNTTHTKLSRENLLKWIDAQLDIPENNIGFLPDKIERQLKAQMYMGVLNMLDYIMETTTVNMAGQTMRFDIISDKN